jgi:hypothetical protein
MNTHVDRAREIARRINTGMVWVDADAAQEIAELLETLADVIETQARNITSVDFALTYYSEPELYRISDDEECTLDGGLRARTALGLLRHAPRSLRFLQGEPS